MELNNDYNEILKQIRHIEENIYKCTTPKLAASYVSTYCSLVYFYYLNTGVSVYHKNIKKNKYVYNIAHIKMNEMLNKGDNNYLQNQEFHFKIINSFINVLDSELERIYEDNLDLQDSRAYSNIFNLENDEAEDILKSYFQENDASLLDVYEELKESGHLFLLNRRIDSLGMTVFNPIENRCNVLLQELPKSIKSMGTLTHELGHVKDFLDYGERFSKKQQASYSFESIYTEVLSAMAEQRFFEYLIANDIYKDEAKRCLFNYYHSYLYNLDTAVLYSILDKEQIKFANKESLTKADICQMAGVHIDGDEVNDFFTEEISLNSSLRYSYGILVTANIINDEEIYQDFLNIRNGYFDGDKLMGIGINERDGSKKLVKNVRKYLN